MDASAQTSAVPAEPLGTPLPPQPEALPAVPVATPAVTAAPQLKLPTMDVAVPPKKHRMVAVLLGVVLSFIVIGGASGAGYYYYVQRVTPEQVLQGVHDRYTGAMIAFLDKIDVAERWSATADVNVTVPPSEGKGIAESKMSFKSNAKADLSNPGNAQMEAKIMGNFRSGITAVMGQKLGYSSMGLPQLGEKEIGGSIDVTVRLVKTMLYVQLASLSINGEVGGPFTLPESAKGKWYQTSLDGARALTGKDPKGTPVAPPKMQNPKQALAEVKTRLKTYFQTVKFVRPVAMLPKENGSFRIEVETDSVMLETAINDWYSAFLVGSGAQLAKAKEEMEVHRKRVMQNIPPDMYMRGTVTVTPVIYTIRKFEAKVFERKDGAEIATITYEHDSEHTSFVVNDIRNPKMSWKFTKKGEDFAIGTGAESIIVISGKISSKLLHMDIFADKANPIATVDMDIAQWGGGTLKAKGSIKVPMLEFALQFDEIEWSQKNSFKDLTMALVGSLSLKGENLGTFSVRGQNKEESQVSVETPATTEQLEKLIMEIMSAQQAHSAATTENLPPISFGNKKENKKYPEEMTFEMYQAMNKVKAQK